MNCHICGYEIEKPNLKTCPLCGSSLKMENKEEAPAQGKTTIDEQEDINVVEQELLNSNDVEIQYPEQKLCPRCHEPLPSSGNFCPNCGLDTRKQETEINYMEQSVIDIVHQSEPAFVPQSSYEPEQASLSVHNPKQQSVNRNEGTQNIVYQESSYEEEEPKFENGGYYPYPEDENTNPDGYENGNATSSFSTGLTIAISIIVSILLGGLLYIIT